MIRSIINLAFHEYKKRRNFINYAVIGVSGATLDYASFLLMTQWIPLNYLLINTISTTFGITNNFYLNARFNFEVKDRLLIRFFSFYSVGLVGLLISSILLYISVDLMAISPPISKLFIIFIVVVLQYTLNKRISFQKSSKDLS